MRVMSSQDLPKWGFQLNELKEKKEEETEELDYS